MNLQELLLYKETEEKFGYKIQDLSYGSTKKVIHKCDVCGQPKETTYSAVVQGRALAHSKCKSIKRNQTNLERYGFESPADNVEIHKKLVIAISKIDKTKANKRRRETNLEKYGVEYNTQSAKVQEKTKKTCLQKYGTETAIGSPQVRKKIDDTLMRRFGTKHALQNKQVQERAKQTIRERYGVDNISQIPQSRDKSRQTCMINHGVEYPNQMPEYRNKLKEWCIANPDSIYTSKSEDDLLRWVQQCYLNAKKYRDNVHEIDVFIPEINLGIEYNGLFWHREDAVGRGYHLLKTQYFKEKGIKIIHIFEHEWHKKQEQVKSFLLSAMGKNKYKIGARKCDLIWSESNIDIQEVHNFLSCFHLQGKPHATCAIIKVLYNNELLAVATFGKHHRNNKDWVLTRFCTKTNYTIQGVLSRVSKLASQQLKEDILSWADYRLSQGNGYEKAGWAFEKLLPPDYFYHKGGWVVLSKQSRQKKKIKTPTNMTESEHAKVDGLNRVYDCGKMRYRYKYVRSE